MFSISLASVLNKFSRFYSLILTVLLGITLIPVTQADESARETFQLAEKYLVTGNEARFNELFRALHYYPLQPYLEQQRLMKNLNVKHLNAIDSFLTTYKNTPLDWPLRKKWLNYLAKRDKQALYLKYFKPTSNAALTCQFYLYQLKAGLSDKVVLPKVTKLWTVGKSQPDVCDPLFSQWQKQGYRTADTIWQRVEKAADGGKSSLLPYLIKLLPDDLKYQGELWRKVRSNPAYVSRLSRFKKMNEKDTQILTYGLRRYVWRDPDNALEVFKKAQQRFPFTAQQINSIEARFAKALASKGHKEAKVWFAKLNDSQFTSDLIQWQITEILRREDWQQIKTDLLTIPESQQSRLQWRYWYGRSLLETNEPEQGLAVLTEVAQERHYYGFLAAGYLNAPVQLKHMPVEVTAQEVNKVLSYPAAKRAFEFFHLGRFSSARSEWNFWLKKLSKQEKLVAAKVAYDKGWYDRAIFTLANVGYLNDVDLRFPLAFDQDINQFAKQKSINPAWAFAITRRESSFMVDANSPVGASGLMQLMPATAKQLARKKMPRKKLYNAQKNIALGTKYLKQLLDRYNGNIILATASYNAGPHRIKQWIKERPDLPADIWIETIPFKETREYVKSVMAYKQIYQLKTGQKSQLFAELSTRDINKLL